MRSACTDFVMIALCAHLGLKFYPQCGTDAIACVADVKSIFVDVPIKVF